MSQSSNNLFQYTIQKYYSFYHLYTTIILSVENVNKYVVEQFRNDQPVLISINKHMWLKVIKL